MKRVNAGETALRVLGPLSFLALWEAAVRLHWLNPGLFAAPTQIVAAFGPFIASGALLTNAEVTLQRILIGLVIGGVPGTLLGLAMGMNRYVRAYFDPLVRAGYPIPKIALVPLAYFIFGLGEGAKWAIVSVGVFFLMCINAEAGVRQIDPLLLDVARAFRARPLTVFFRVLLPGALPSIFTGLKLAVGIAVVLDVAAEFLATKSGLGYTIEYSRELLDTSTLYVALVAVSVLGVVLALLVDLAETLILPWRQSRR